MKESEDFDLLLAAARDVLEEMLRSEGMVFPFALALANKGKDIHIWNGLPEEPVPSASRETILANLKKALATVRRSGEYRAFGLVTDSDRPPGARISCDASGEKRRTWIPIEGKTLGDEEEQGT
ncbi:MAG: hypothetical protein HY720_26045 [Planctomycetes bacterium]|nr:hypothetical protein [Planctomycetota bacterium]